MKYWVTRYALSGGIIEVDGELSDCCNTMLCYMKSGKYSKGSNYQCAHGKDFHDSRDKAVCRAIEMKKAKIASLKKQIKRVEALEFK